MAMLPWDRRDDETAAAYAAFRVYLALPSETRSIDAAWRVRPRAKPDDAEKRASRRWREWSGVHGWAARARAWDDHLAQRVQEDAEREELDRLRQFRETMRRHGGSLQKATAKLTEMGVGGLERLMEKVEKGEQPLAPNEVAYILRSAAHTARAAADLEALGLAVDVILSRTEE